MKTLAHPSAGPGEDRAEFIDTKTLLKRLPVSRRTLQSWLAEEKIPVVRLAGRRLLFHWASVQSTLIRAQRGGSV
jgi:excisionase family DNA binding protein